MNNKTVIITTVAAVAGLTALELVKKARAERKAREAILKFQKNIRALGSAHDTIMAGIAAGEYQGKSHDDILIDYEFYKLVANPKL